MKNSRGFKYYIKFYLVITGAYIIYVLYNTYLAEWKFNAYLLLSVVYLPILFVGFIYIFDTVLDKILPKSKVKKKDAFLSFANEATKSVDEQLSLSIEDFRRLRDNHRFQKALYQTYKISENGETEEINFTFIRKKFKRDTIEYKALNIVINEVEKKM